MKGRDTQGRRHIVLGDPLLKQLEKVWIAEGEELNDFGYWIRKVLDQKVKSYNRRIKK